MSAKKKILDDKFRKYHFQLKHLMILFVIIIIFQMTTSLIYKISLRNFLNKTQEWYQRDFVERLANLSATSLELLLETTLENPQLENKDTKQIVQAFNIVLSQQLLQQHVQKICLLFYEDKEIVAIDNGHVLLSYILKSRLDEPFHNEEYQEAIRMYQRFQNEIRASEQTRSILENNRTFHVFVPFVPKGEYFGVLYMKSTPEFGFVTDEIKSSYNKSGLIFTALILFGFLTMFYISSSTVGERDEVQKLLFQEREKQLKKDIHYQKEALFTKRIYHTHHKAEKVMGFIKEDIKMLSTSNIDKIGYRIEKYANFISRVIYDMKWYDPPIQAIRGPIFKTNLNEVILFIVENIFLRVSSRSKHFEFKVDLDEKLPVVQVNEFVVWEIIEPLLQNCIDHGGEEKITIIIKTKYFPELNKSQIVILDNGNGIQADLLERDINGVPLIFQENSSTKNNRHSSGYGCYIAYEIAKQRCGWDIKAKNIKKSGAMFTVTIPYVE